MTIFRTLVQAAAASLLLAIPAVAQEGTVIEGQATLVDADIVTIGEARIILWGVDAPERAQTCETSSGDWNCWETARRETQLLTERGPWTCTEARDPDRFGNKLAVCEVDGINVNADLISRGLAMAYVQQTELFEPEQDAAQEAKIGLWQDGVEFHEPWAWRGAMTPGGFR